ncbi:MAG: hypothetical protein JWQ96_397 [Segetibacter sp.]|nr:hypothetical protein [Segetibacter sp.]
MGKADEIKRLLEKIQRTHTTQRAGYITRVQNAIQDDTITLNAELQQELSELADDLNYYEVDSTHRVDDAAYFGEERLLEKISTAIEKIDAFLDGQ